MIKHNNNIIMSNSNNMYIIKRDGLKQKVSFDKILYRLQNLSDKLDVNIVSIAQKVIAQIYDNIKTTELDELSAQICISLLSENLDYGKLASRIIISNNHKNTSPSFSESMTILYNNYDNDIHKPLISEKVYNIIVKNKNKLNSIIKYERDFDFNYFAFKTLERAYLLRKKNKIIERIQHLFMRVSIGIHFDDIKSVIISYNYMSQKYFIHATPTLYNSGTKHNQLASCFLMGTEDSVGGIYKTITDCAHISKVAGGIGIHISNIRGKGSYISGTNGYSSGIIPMAKVYNETARYINQSGRRPGSFALYLEPHHTDILDFLELKKNHGNENERARDLFLALWISDLFMERVKTGGQWSLFNEHDCPGLTDAYGDEYKKLYEKYESEGKYVKQIPVRKIWESILNSQMETGTPYMLFKDNINRKSNQKNVGTIKSSNLCAEIVEYSDDKEYAVCTLASIGLSRYVDDYDYNKISNITIYTKQDCKYCKYTKEYFNKLDIKYIELDIEEGENRDKLVEKIGKDFKTVPQIFVTTIDKEDHIGGYTELVGYFKPSFNFEKLKEVMNIVVRNLNKIIDINYYPVKETKVSNKRHRPMGVGVQGLADVFAKMRIPFDSVEGKKLNRNIFETMYYGAMVCSHKLAQEEGEYSTFKGSPLSYGKFQFDLWDVKPEMGYDWNKLRNDIMKDGVRNSLCLALMPTASTSQILGNNECFEPFTSNIYVRRTIAGDFMVINKYLIRDLMDLKLWNKDMKDKLIYYNGSVQEIKEIPDKFKMLYKTAWEMKQKSLIDLSIERGPYICQTQSMNLFFEEPTHKILTGAFFYGWSKGLKTGSYYIRSRPKVQAQQFTLDVNKIKELQKQETKYDVCESCSG